MNWSAHLFFLGTLNKTCSLPWAVLSTICSVSLRFVGEQNEDKVHRPEHDELTRAKTAVHNPEVQYVSKKSPISTFNNAMLKQVKFWAKKMSLALSTLCSVPKNRWIFYQRWSSVSEAPNQNIKTSLSDLKWWLELCDLESETMREDNAFHLICRNYCKYNRNFRDKLISISRAN